MSLDHQIKLLTAQRDLLRDEMAILKPDDPRMVNAPRMLKQYEEQVERAEAERLKPGQGR